MQADREREGAMSRAREWTVRVAEYCGVLVLVVAALPLLALGAFVARGVAVIVGLFLMAGLLLLLALRPMLRGRLGAALGLRAVRRV